MLRASAGTDSGAEVYILYIWMQNFVQLAAATSRVTDSLYMPRENVWNVGDSAHDVHYLNSYEARFLLA